MPCVSFSLSLPLFFSFFVQKKMPNSIFFFISFIKIAKPKPAISGNKVTHFIFAKVDVKEVSDHLHKDNNCNGIKGTHIHTH